MAMKTPPAQRAAGRKKLASKGDALPDGSFPIPNLCLAGDTHIALLHGREVPIADLVGEDTWIYAYDLARRAIIPALATDIRLTLEDAELVEVRLDSGESIRCTATHPFLMRNGTYVPAGSLLPGDSLMPLYRKYVTNGPNPYQHTWQPFFARWEPTHKMVSREVTGEADPNDGRSVHHVSGDSLDNQPQNLVSLTRSEHMQMHKSDPHWSAEYCGEISRSRWGNPGAKEHMREAMRASNRRREESGVMTWQEFNARSNAARRKVIEDKLSAIEGGMQAVHAWYMGGATFAELATTTGISRTTMLRYFREAGLPLRITGHTKGGHPTERQGKAYQLREDGMSYGDIAKELGYTGSAGAYHAVRRAQEKLLHNHKVVAVTPAGTGDVYDMTVEGPENFGLSCGVFVHNSYLKKAIRSVGRAPASKRAALKALIRKRAKELGALNEPGVKGTWAFANDSEALEMAAMTGKMPKVRGAADVTLSRSGPGSVTVMHTSTGSKVGTLDKGMGGWQATHRTGKKLDPAPTMAASMSGLIGYHNKLAAGQPASADMAADGSAVNLATSAATSSDGPRVTAVAGSKPAATAMSAEVTKVYKKLIAKGMKPAQAMGLANRAAAMHAKAAAKAA